MRRYYIIILLLGCCLYLKAQNTIDNTDYPFWGRPELYMEDSADSPTPVKSIRKVGSQSTAPLKSVGEKNIPIILVNFADRKFTLGSSTDLTKLTDSDINTYYDYYCNGTKDGNYYKLHGSFGSVRDYFTCMSDSTFLPNFSIIGPVTLDSCYAYYGKNTSDTSKDVNYSKFTNEAISKAKQLYLYWSDFDNDGNGTVDMVFFIYAGWGESNSRGNDPNAIWAKESTRSSTIDGTVFATSAACHELYPNQNTKQTDESGNFIGYTQTKTDGIGVFVHELSHALGLPDFYDTNNKAFGMDIWSVMDYGEYTYNGFTPCNYTAYERDFMGWQKLEELTSPGKYTLKCFGDGGHGVKIVNDANANEYYVLENRQRKGWDKCILDTGLQVTHVDYNSANWNNNTVNTSSAHQRMTIIAANNSYKGTNVATSSTEWVTSLEGNLYPYNDNNALTNSTTPAATVFTGTYMNKPITRITQNEDGSISFYYIMDGPLDLNKDGDVDIADICYLTTCLINGTQTQEQDVNTDTETDIEDIRYLINTVLDK